MRLATRYLRRLWGLGFVLGLAALWLVAMTPEARAHGAHHRHVSPASPPAALAVPMLKPTSVFDAGRLGADIPCPPGQDHGSHRRCCAGIASCFSGAGAVVAVDEAPALSAARPPLTEPPGRLASGLAERPAAPPPRPFL